MAGNPGLSPADGTEHPALNPIVANQITNSGGQRGIQIGQIVFGVIWTLFSSVFLCIGLWITWKGVSQSAWKPTPCTIERFEIRDDPKKSPVFQEDLRFRYEWEGRTYTGTRLRPESSGDDEYETLARAREQLLAEAGREAPEGLRTECRVDPAHPENASLLPPSGSNWFGLIFAAFGGGFMLIGLSLITSAIRNRHKTALSDQSSRSSGSPFPVAIFFVIFALVGLGITCGLVIPTAIRYFSAKSWVETPATIVWGRVESHSGSKGGTTYSADLFYRYTFKGREYRSNQYSMMSGSSSGRDSKQETVDSHPPGSTLTCFVNPEKPWQAVVKRDIGASALFALFPLPFLGIGIGGLWWSFKNKRRQDSRSTPQSGSAGGRQTVASVPDLPERVLRAGKSRLVNLGASLFICAFWNGIVSVFVGIAWNAWRKGQPETFLMIFLIPFVLIGSVLLLNVPYRLLMLFLARYELRLTPGTLRPGGTATLTWKRVGGFGQAKSLSIRLTGTETATWRNGKNTSSATSVFHDETFAELSSISISANRPVAIKLPDHALPTFKGDSNRITWKLRMEVALPGFPKITDDYEIDVRPQRRDELNP